MPTYNLTKKYFPFDDYAKKGIVQFEIKDDEGNNISNLVPDSISYNLNKDDENFETIIFSNTEENPLKESVNFYETSNGAYRFDVFYDLYKKTYNLTGSTSNTKFDSRCLTDYKWFSGCGFNVEYRTENIPISFENEDGTYRTEDVYYFLSCNQIKETIAEQITNEETGEIEEILKDIYKYQWTISMKNITTDEIPVVMFVSGEPNEICKDSIPAEFYYYDNEEITEETVFFTSNLNAELNDRISVVDVQITMKDNTDEENPITHEIKFDNILFVTNQIFREDSNSEWKDFRFSPVYGDMRSQMLEFLNFDNERVSFSFMTKVFPESRTSFITKLENSIDNSSNSSFETQEDKSNKIEFITSVSNLDYKYLEGLEIEENEQLYASDFFLKNEEKNEYVFQSLMPYNNYILEIEDLSTDDVVQHNFNLYQALDNYYNYENDNSGSESSLSSESSSDSNSSSSDYIAKEPFKKGFLISSKTIFDNKLDDVINILTVPENEDGEIPFDSQPIIQFQLKKDLITRMKKVSFLIKSEVIQYNEHNVGMITPSDYFFRNGKFIEFTTIPGESIYSVKKEALLKYLDYNNKGYVNEKFYVFSCHTPTNLFPADKIDSNVLSYMSIPSLKNIEIVYYPNKLTIENKQDISFVNSQVKSTDYRFYVKYRNNNGDSVYFNNLVFDKIEVANTSQSVGEIYREENSSSGSSGSSGASLTKEQVKYPYIFDNQDGITENDLQVILTESKEEINQTFLAQLVSPNQERNDDDYYHFYYPFGQKVSLEPETLSVYGIGNKTSDYENEQVAKNAVNANGNYKLISGSGTSRIFKHEKEEYYIKCYNDADSRYYFCISTTSGSTNRSNTLCYTNSNDFSTLETKDFPSVNWGGWKGNCVFSNFKMTYIPAETEGGKTKIYYIRFMDKYGNQSETVNTTTEIYQVAPYELSLKITGSNGSSDYTGFKKRHNRFLPFEFVELDFSAQSKTKMKYRISTNSSIMNLDEKFKHFSDNGKKKLIVKLMPETSQKMLLDKDVAIRIIIEFKDEAENVSSIEKTIKYITQLHRTENFNLLEESVDYTHQLYSVNNSSSNRIARKKTSNTEFYRSWNEIWFPETHGTILNPDGSIDENQAIRIAQITEDNEGELSQYDKLALSDSGLLSKDSDGRILQDMNSWSKDKKYPSNLNKIGLNSDEKDYKYWIVDNTGNADFKLEFEVFDFDGQETTIPANYSSPYSGDCVVIYDASTPGCTEEIYDDNGRISYVLKDSSKLRQLFALKGSYDTNANIDFKLLSDEIYGNLIPSDSGFITPSITSTSRICIIPYSDSQSERSGFKLKAGPKHAFEYTNYESIEKIGEFWVHQSPDTSNGEWVGCNSLQMNYNYYASQAIIDREKMTIKFDEFQNYNILGTFTHYLYLYADGTNSYPYSYFTEDINGNYPKVVKQDEIINKDYIKTFMLYNDDLVDYSEPSFFVIYNGESANKSNYYNFANSEIERDGRLTSNYTINKDTGVLLFSGVTPLGRITGDYYYHTYYRLTNDGYGDLSFYNQTLVPASVNNSHTDWTYVDLKIINEGTNQLNNGTLKFLARGYITNGTVVDTVLDNNRPWDVQMGTVQETVLRTGAEFAGAYSSLQSPSRSVALEKIKSQTLSFGTLDPKSTIYVRVYWCIATSENNGVATAWVDCTRGDKLFSAELSGKYYIFTTGA